MLHVKPSAVPAVDETGSPPSYLQIDACWYIQPRLRVVEEVSKAIPDLPIVIDHVAN